MSNFEKKVVPYLTYLGTRPILPDELEQYELHHRARIAIKPGITGMWQVSGRSDMYIAYAVRKQTPKNYKDYFDKRIHLIEVKNFGTNTLIDQIFLSIEDLIDAKMVCGAGGGGFLQVILKKGVQKADVHKRLKDVFQDNPVDVWDCEII